MPYGWAYVSGAAIFILTVANSFQFPWKKVPQYIFAQVFGSFVAAMLLVGQYYPQLTALAAEYHAKGLSLNSPGGPGSILCSFPGATQSYGYLFFIEFFADVFVVCVDGYRDCRVC